MKDASEAFEALSGSRVVDAQAGLTNLKGTLVESAGLVEITLVVEDLGEVVQNS